MRALINFKTHRQEQACRVINQASDLQKYLDRVIENYLHMRDEDPTKRLFLDHQKIQDLAQAMVEANLYHELGI